MKTAALKKKHLAEVPVDAPADPLRNALAAAIESKRKADDLVAKRFEAIQAAREAAWAAEERIEKLEAKIPEAEAADVARAATTLAKDPTATVSVPWQGDNARSAVRTEKERLKLTRAAIAKNEGDVDGLKDDAADAASEVLLRRDHVVLSRAQALLAEAEALKIRLAVNMKALDEIIYKKDRLAFSNMIRGERAREKREAVLEGVRRGAEKLRFTDNVAAYTAAEEASARWQRAMTGLETDPNTELPT